MGIIGDNYGELNTETGEYTSVADMEREMHREQKIRTEKALAFVEHIENHLRELQIEGKVVCKICGKTIDEIYNEQFECECDNENFPRAR